jgi:hypothetical protein
MLVFGFRDDFFSHKSLTKTRWYLMALSGTARMFSSEGFDRLGHVIRNGTQGGRERKRKVGKKAGETGNGNGDEGHG